MLNEDEQCCAKIRHSGRLQAERQSWGVQRTEFRSCKNQEFLFWQGVNLKFLKSFTFCILGLNIYILTMHRQEP